MKEKEIERCLKALANIRRLSIVRYVKKENESNVSDIANEIKLSFAATSRHLNLLASADILDREQRGLEMFYYISQSLPEPARRIISIL
ncbi:MAG: metalloregulator ArsR/SmtB family transcription factor [Patescibacteria group bacterium]